MPKNLHRLVLTAVGGIALLQVVPLFPRTNPSAPPSSSLRNQVEVPTEIDHLLRRSCWNCHSNETSWPWYAHVAPIRWLIVRDVEKARRTMNFSSWTEQAGKKLQQAVGMLAASCSDVTVGRMPKPEYLFLHSEANLSEADKRGFCAWTAREGGRLLVLKRKQAADAAEASGE